MMRACPYCRQTPEWFFARGTSWLIRDGKHYFIPTGCEHFEAKMGKKISPVRDDERPAFELRWDEAAEALFAEYTMTRPWSDDARKEYEAKGQRVPEAAAGWNDEQRASFRAKLWPKPLPVIPTELFDRYADESPTTP